MDEVTFGRYRLLSVIGRGAMGTVYKAHDTVIDREVAIKVLPNELGADREYRVRFRREALTAARLNAPHIIPIHDTGEIDGRLYLVMPIVEGIDVQGLLQRDGPMRPDRAVSIIEQLAAALDAAHAAGLVHRDIKPTNALVTGDDFVYLIDFGIAHDKAATRLTSADVMVGTLGYMAPEGPGLAVGAVVAVDDRRRRHRGASPAICRITLAGYSSRAARGAPRTNRRAGRGNRTARTTTESRATQHGDGYHGDDGDGNHQHSA